MGTETQPRDDGEDDPEHADHLADLDDGCGCTEIWEQLAEIRDAD